jgi:NTP pyrophosphatase (non-canonical NTP hydrolase)
MELIDLIEAYYNGRDLKYPDAWQSLGWATTELGEVYELLLARDGGWVRNNPQDHDNFSKEKFSEELGDVIMMLMVAGYVEGVNPIQSLKDKINSKLEKLNGPKE